MPWRGHLFVEAGWLLYDGPAATTTPHAHHAHQIVLAVDTPVRLTGPNGQPIEIDAAVIPADVAHAIASPVARVVILYVAPESRPGRLLRARVGTSQTPRHWAAAAAPLQDLRPDVVATWDGARRVAAKILDELLASAPPARPWPPAIQRLVAMLPTRLDATLRVTALADELEMSASRLSHLVTEHLGIPFRPYVLWLRLQRAAGELARGRAITEAAHVAGFADGAHMTRVFRRMFGIAPSEVSTVATWHLAGA